MENRYNPMSKEFQDECKKFGLTGRQLTAKYQKKGRYLEKNKEKVRICCDCRSHNTYIKTDGVEQWHKHECQKIICTKYLCEHCYKKIDYKERYICDRRTGNLRDPSQIFGDNCQELTCIWRSTISTVPVEDMNKKLDNYCTSIDHSIDSELGIIQTKGSLYSSIEKRWSTDTRKEQNKTFDYLIYYCASKDGKIIERLYIFPKKEITKKRLGLSIMKNPSNRNGRCPNGGWYEKYRIMDEEILKNVNKIWKEIIKGVINE